MYMPRYLQAAPDGSIMYNSAALMSSSYAASNADAPNGRRDP